MFGSDFPLRLYPRTEEGSGLAALVAEARRVMPADALGAVRII